MPWMGRWGRGIIVGFIVGGGLVCGEMVENVKKQKDSIIKYIKKLYIFEFNLQCSNKQYVHTISKEYHNKYAT